MKKIYEFYKTSEDDLTCLSQLETVYDDKISREESLLINKTLLYIVQRLNLFLMSPTRLQSDLADLGFTAEKSEIIVKLYWESNRNIIKNLKTEESPESVDVGWTIKTTLVDETSSRCKKHVARVCLKTNDQEVILEDLDHSALGSLFDKFETIQKELDVLSANK